MNSLNPVRSLDFLSAPEPLPYQGGHSVLHLGDQIEDKAEVGLCIRGEFASREV